jgi:hypothetical protein
MVGHIGNPLATRFAVLGYRKEKMKFKTDQEDLVAVRKDHRFSHDTPLIDNDGSLKSDLKKIEEGIRGEELGNFQQNFRIQAAGTYSKYQKAFLWEGRSKEKRNTHAQIDYADGHQRRLRFHGTKREEYIGISSENFHVFQKDIALLNSRRTYVHIEMDEFSPEKFVIVLKVQDGYRYRDRSEVVNLIDDINRRFSSHPSEPFIKDYELPSEDEIDEYRRVYGMTRVYISGYKLLEKIEELDIETFKQWVHEYFTDALEKENRNYLGLEFVGKIEKKFKLFNLECDLINLFTDLKKQTKKLDRNYKNIFPILDKFIFHQMIQKYGLGLLRKLVDDQSLFVMGDISGIFPSFSNANDFQQRQRRHFAANHWGNLSLVPPIQSFNRFGRIVYPASSVAPHIEPDLIFGPVPDGYPQEIKKTHY